MARVINGEMTLEFISDATKKRVGDKLHFKIVNEVEARSREINGTLGKALVAMADGPAFSDAFNPEADKTLGTMSAHFSTKGKYNDGEPAFEADITWYDLDSVEMGMFIALFQQISK